MDTLPQDGNPCELTILMPCLNEAETLATCITKAQDYLRCHGISGEVVVADNGSTDGSQAIARSCGARVVAVPQRGYGAALIGGIAAARGRFVIMGDADDSYDFTSLQSIIKGLRAGADIVMGNRFKGGIAPGAMPALHRYLGNPLLSWLGRLFFRIPIGDFHCGLRGFSNQRICALKLRTTGMEFASEMIVRAALAGYRIEEVPVTLRRDGRSRQPHLRTWRDGWRHLSFLLIYSPRWLFLYPGIAMILLAGLAGALLFPGGMDIGGIGFDIHTFIVMNFLLVVGTQAISLAVISRRFAASHGMIPPSQLSGLLQTLTLERLLIVAAVLFTGGLAGMLYCTLQWAQSGFGPLDYSQMLRLLIFSMAAIATGIQLALTAFLSSMLEVPTK